MTLNTLISSFIIVLALKSQGKFNLKVYFHIIVLFSKLQFDFVIKNTFLRSVVLSLIYTNTYSSFFSSAVG